jgi:hypothetical protein
MNKICLMPWLTSNTRIDGSVRVCCHGEHVRQTLKDENGIEYNCKINSPFEIRNSPYLKKLRLDMLSGNEIPECIECFNEEKNGFVSKRKHINRQRSIFFEMVYKDTLKDGSLTDEFPITNYDLRFSNLCNCKCKTCGYPNTNMLGPTLEWGKDSVYLNEVKKHINQVLELYICGGEPMLINEHWQFLNYIVNNDNSKNIKIRYNTNGTYLEDWMFDLWKKFKFVSLNFSLDSIGETLELIRPPCKWNKIKRNFELFNRRSSYDIVGDITTTVSSLNVFHIPELIEWLLRKKYKYIREFRPHMLYTPNRYNVINNKKLFEIIYPLYKDCLDINDYKIGSNIKVILKLIKGD